MEISNFKEENIIYKIDQGVEGIVYLYNDNGRKVAFKKLFDDEEIIKSNRNKELKISILQNEEVLKNDMKLLNRIYYMGKFIGYTSVYEPYDPLDYGKSLEYKLYALRLLRERYEELNNRGIYIGDFNNQNFCLTDGRIKLYDIDNFRIDSLDLHFNVYNSTMEEYFNKCKTIDNIDYYCFNYFALSYLMNIEVDYVLKGEFIEYLPKILRKNEVIEFIKSLEFINDNTKIEKDSTGKRKTLLNLIK